MTYDHVIPVSLGGTRTDDNRVIACRWCNSRKADMLVDEWVTWLITVDLQRRGPIAVRKGAAVLAKFNAVTSQSTSPTSPHLSPPIP
jgi:hypothetical protein